MRSENTGGGLPVSFGRIFTHLIIQARKRAVVLFFSLLPIYTQGTTSHLVNISQTPILFPFLIALGETVSVFCMDHAPLRPDFVHFSPCPALHPHPFPDYSRQRYPKPTSDRAVFLPKAFLEVSHFMSKINLLFKN